MAASRKDAAGLLAEIDSMTPPSWVELSEEWAEIASRVLPIP